MNMDSKLKRQATLCMFIAMVDYFDGNMEWNTTGITKAYNNEEETVVVECSDGTVHAVGNMDVDIMAKSIDEWKEQHSQEFELILASLR